MLALGGRLSLGLLLLLLLLGPTRRCVDHEMENKFFDNAFGRVLFNILEHRFTERVTAKNFQQICLVASLATGIKDSLFAGLGTERMTVLDHALDVLDSYVTT